MQDLARNRWRIGAGLSAFLVALSLNGADLYGTTWPAENAGEERISAGQKRLFYEANGFFVAPGDFPIRVVFLGDPPAELDAAAVERQARRALEEWSRVPCSTARFEYAGRRENAQDLAPGELPFLFAEPGEHACFSESSIGWTALTCGINFPDKTIFLNQRDYEWSEYPAPFQFLESGQFEVPGTMGERPIVDLRGVLTHEFGHILGLGHSSDPLATMTASYRRDGGQAHLAVDDKVGICELYPARSMSDECRAGRDCRPRESCELVELASRTSDREMSGGSDAGKGPRVRLCREFRGQVGDACAPDQLICDEVCVFSADPAQFGYCSAQCDAEEPQQAACPGEFECVAGLLGTDDAFCEWAQGPYPVQDSCAGGCAGAQQPGSAPSFWAWFIGCCALFGLVKRRRARADRRAKLI